MLNEEEEKREHKIKSLVSRVQDLPKSLQLSLQGEMKFLSELKKSKANG